MADCLIHEVMPFGKRLCPSLNIDNQITLLMDAMKFFFPIFEKEQNVIRNMMLTPEPQPVSY